MAINPSFVGTPSTQNTLLQTATYLLQSVFTAGVSGSAIKSFHIACAADQQLYATVSFSAGGVSYFQCTIPLVAATSAAFALGNTAIGLNVLVDTYFPGVDQYLELGADEVVKLTVHDVAGGAPDAGESVMVRIVGADY